ncbi:MAG TPA: hypothetical protein VIK99_03740 [Thermaerobacter sp.]
MAGRQAELVVDPQKRVVAVRLEGELDPDEPAKERLVGAVAQALRGLLGLAPLGETRAVIALQGAGAAAASGAAPKAAQPAASFTASAGKKSAPSPRRVAVTTRAKVLMIARQLAGDRYRPLLAQRIRQMFGVEVPEDRDPEVGALKPEQWTELLRYLERAAERRAG